MKSVQKAAETDIIFFMDIILKHTSVLFGEDTSVNVVKRTK